MALFAIFALRDVASQVDIAVQQKFSEAAYKIEAGKWIVESEASTAKEVTTILGLAGTWHIVLTIGGYFGYAQSDMWEWIAAKRAKTNG
jgi:hypothetical protein